MLWLDAYERRARLAPGLLALLPIAFTVVALGINKIPVASGCIGLLSAAGGPVLLAAYVRRLGLSLQDQLWASKGGAPTTLALRLEGRQGNLIQRDLWRRAIQATARVQLLDEIAERADPIRADDAIEAAVANLREMTRGDEFSMVAAENKNYGFQRNLYGLRHLGRIIALCSALVLALVLAYQLARTGHRFAPSALIAGLIVDACLAVVWFIAPSLNHVWKSGEKYASQLLQAAVTLELSLPTPTPIEPERNE